MTHPNLSGRIAVLGLGRSGEAVVDWALARPGMSPDDVVVFAEHDTPALQAAADVLRRRDVRVELGVSHLGDDEAFDLIVSSPGIAPHRPLLEHALGTGVPVISELELAFQVSKAPVIAVTGTNGKTTTTALIAHLLRTAGLEAEAGGNIGRPALGVARELPADGFLVAECSSFQLALTLEFKPKVAVLLNVTPDHLDWHGTMFAYVGDKVRIFANQDQGDVAIVDVDDPGSAAVVAVAVPGGASLVTVSAEGRGAARVEDGMLVVLGAHGRTELVRVDELLVRGAHNVSNALAASAASLAVGAPAESVRQGLRTFAPIEHRLEPVATVGGVRFVNDSKATNPDAVLKALTAFDGSPVIVLLGGRNKGIDFAQLAGACAEHCRLCIAYGEAGEALAASLEEAGAPYVTAHGMSDALAAAIEVSEAGDVVLLSPACASFDEFSGFEERGTVFSAAVLAHAEAAR